jgi:hypothetical protein
VVKKVGRRALDEVLWASALETAIQHASRGPLSGSSTT